MMSCHDPDVVRDALVGGLCGVDVGPFHIDYVNSVGRRPWLDTVHLALLTRPGKVRDVIELDSDYFDSLVNHYGAEGTEVQV